MLYRRASSVRSSRLSVALTAVVSSLWAGAGLSLEGRASILPVARPRFMYTVAGLWIRRHRPRIPAHMPWFPAPIHCSHPSGTTCCGMPWCGIAPARAASTSCLGARSGRRAPKMNRPVRDAERGPDPPQPAGRAPHPLAGHPDDKLRRRPRASAARRALDSQTPPALPAT